MIKVFFAVLFISCNAFAWGTIGHSIVCQIAEENLTPKAKDAVSTILGKKSLSDACSWPDQIRKNKDYEYAITWHYVTIPNGQTYQSSQKEQKGDVVEASERMIKVLMMPKRTAKERREALSFLGHFIGDLHQPLHVGRENDRGGNKCLVGGKHGANLHAIWDSKIIEIMKLEPWELAKKLSRVSVQEVTRLQSGSIESWVSESQSLRESAVYPSGGSASKEQSPFCAKSGTEGFKPDQAIKLPDEYLESNAEIVSSRLQEGGIRLAGILNSIFR